jgi:lysine 2,3-aminomutase
LLRINRRHDYQSNPVHTTLKDKREKRDELKEKKFQAQQTKTVDKPQVKE